MSNLICITNQAEVCSHLREKEINLSLFNTLMLSLVPCSKIKIGLPTNSLPVKPSSEVHFSISLIYLALARIWSRWSNAVHMSCALLSSSAVFESPGLFGFVMRSVKLCWSHITSSWTMGSGGRVWAFLSIALFSSWQRFLEKSPEVTLMSGGDWGYWGGRWKVRFRVFFPLSVSIAVEMQYTSPVWAVLRTDSHNVSTK